MSHRHLRRILTSALTLMLLAIAGIMAYAQTTGFRVVSVMPNPFNPSQGQTATITYSVPTQANYRIYVLNSSGTEIRGIVTYVNEPAGTRTRVWDGKDNYGRVVPSGTYTVVVKGTSYPSGTALTTGTGTVAVASSTTPPPTTGAFAITGITPNPFDPSTGSASIAYTVPTTADLSIVVKNGSGSTIRTLASKTGVAAGSYTQAWDGKNRSGTVVANGTYSVTVSGRVSGTTTSITAATATVSVSTSTTPPPPTTGAFKITGITPNPYDPSTGSATITYTVPCTADFTITVKSGTTAVRTLDAKSAAGAGNYTQTWDGKNNSGATVADGTYTVSIDGKDSSTGAVVTSATATISVSTTVTPPPPPPPPPTTGSELGQTIEGAGSANFAWLKYSGYKFDVAFKAAKTGTITQITMPWKKSSGYGNGNYGTYNFALQTNGSGNFPSGTTIASANNINPTTAMDGYADGAFHFNISASVTAGTIYHLVVTNVDPNPGTNWSSPNTLMTRVQTWDGTGSRDAFTTGSSWSPWSSVDNAFNTAKSNTVNGAHTPLMFTYSDGSVTGDPYYSSAFSDGAYIYGANRHGEYIVWNQASATISKIGVSVAKMGSPAGSLIYHLEKVGSGDLATGTMNTSGVSTTMQTWVYAALPSAVTLQQGSTYRLWFESPSSSSSSNCFFQSIPYTDPRPANWVQTSWGGSASYYTRGNGSSWAAWQTYDLSFSLQ